LIPRTLSRATPGRYSWQWKCKAAGFAVVKRHAATRRDPLRFARQDEEATLFSNRGTP
jgi:hypothetical protein